MKVKVTLFLTIILFLNIGCDQANKKSDEEWFEVLYTGYSLDSRGSSKTPLEFEKFGKQTIQVCFSKNETKTLIKARFYNGGKIYLVVKNPNYKNSSHYSKEFSHMFEYQKEGRTLSFDPVYEVYMKLDN